MANPVSCPACGNRLYAPKNVLTTLVLLAGMATTAVAQDQPVTVILKSMPDSGKAYADRLTKKDATSNASRDEHYTLQVQEGFGRNPTKYVLYFEKAASTEGAKTTDLPYQGRTI